MTANQIWKSVEPIVMPWLVRSSEQGESSGWQVGDWAIYRKSKRSTHPGRRALNIKANTKGETYAYVVDKFWLVDEVKIDGTLVMRTARGKRHVIDPADPNLVRPSLLTRLRWADRFRQLEIERDGTTAVA